MDENREVLLVLWMSHVEFPSAKMQANLYTMLNLATNETVQWEETTSFSWSNIVKQIA